MKATGSIAAAAHSTIGNVASGSAFAIAQSAGTGGAGATALNGGVQVATLSGFAAWGGRKWKSRL